MRSHNSIKSISLNVNGFGICVLVEKNIEKKAPEHHAAPCDEDPRVAHTDVFLVFLEGIYQCAPFLSE
jgi:hypothetical protein